MSEFDSTKLRAICKALTNQEPVFEDPDGRINIAENPVLVLELWLAKLEDCAPGLVPPFDKAAHFSHDRPGHGAYYVVAGVRAHLLAVTGMLRGYLEGAAESSPVTETRTFDFVQDEAIRGIVERDYGEVQRAFVAQCWKSVVILVGRAHRGDVGGPPSAAPVCSSWRLSCRSHLVMSSRPGAADLIEVAIEIGSVGSGANEVFPLGARPQEPNPPRKRDTK